MSRAFLIVLDSCGIGHAPDAARYDDEGANTLGHIIEACDEGRGDAEGLRHGPLAVPNLARLGLWGALATAAGTPLGAAHALLEGASFGSAIETSPGKDTPSGHWEIAGSPVDFDWGYFPQTKPCFPDDLIAALVSQGKLPGILGNCHASGTQIIEELGEEHIASGKPIVYTSVDSVLQIAAHETHFSLQRLYDLCKLGRTLCDRLKIGRVIARPFVGESKSTFKRTALRKDFAMPPPAGGLLDLAQADNRTTVSIGKIGDIFAHRATGFEVKGANNQENIDLTIQHMLTLPEGGLLLANYVDFDTEYGHRRDLPGYGAALEHFDRRLAEIFDLLHPGDLLIISADHGNDPSWRGTDHTREQIPVLALCLGTKGGMLGQRQSFADIGATLAAHLGLPATRKGTSWA